MNTLITGSGRGIGKFMAEKFLEEGHRVFGCSTQVTGSIDHDQYTHFRCDVRRENEVRIMMKNIRSQVGHLDVLINNAGVANMNHLILTPMEVSQRIMDINFQGTFLVTREGAKLLKNSKRGRVVNFTSVAVPMNLAGEAVYVSSKAAVETLTRVLARELGGFGITVNAVGPTPVKTALIAGLPPEKIDQLLDSQPIRRMGTGEDVLNVVRFFLSPASDFITGQVLYLGGVS